MKTSLRKLPIFREATTSFPAKYRLRNEHRNFILMTCHYPNLGSASVMMKKSPFVVRPIRGTTQIWLVTRHQYGISPPVPPQTSFYGETSGGLAKYRLFPQPRSQGSLWLRRKKRKNPGKEAVLLFLLQVLTTTYAQYSPIKRLSA